MGIKVYGSVFSTATRRVTACLHEKEVEYEFIAVDMRSGAHKQEPFISLNPFGKVPALEDGDVKLFESRAISKYISHEYLDIGTPLVYSDAKLNAQVSVWMEVEAHQYDPVASKLAFELTIKKMFGMETDHEVVKEQEVKLGKVLDIYEARLSKTKYLAGDSFSLADLHHLPVLQYLLDTPTMRLFDERPHVSAWCKDILARPSWVKTLAMQ